MNPDMERAGGWRPRPDQTMRRSVDLDRTPEQLRLLGEADLRLEEAETVLAYALTTSTGDLPDATWNATRLIGRARIMLKGVA